ncbi:phosphoesterase [Bradyrhizobium japonicum]|uniref:Phosphoesterase n=1 Tax=Bradyrhizobium japonicum TaxID=375 RepID=A0A0A3XMZ5_BRAJP|nr:metallophosphoesterase family protein [Bradyrhizobium japonicum]KGT75760.1 phosphoesterase [Bradyrhizobium japonicum]MCS3895068.1 putative phosphodiesterase [Bradyrhizobium japonicum USDA 38]MCS3947583.1 putative phosphodiesterase [Bradyrhizobium japonicum]MCW2219586.1 putative phosphodiesterase [Bradyrhizobium japonicum]MCW2344200.1 putative phosphodiesterase [Bradyrhizobium japonicum]
MRLAVISDIHGNLAALEAALADIKARGVDRTVNLGDCVTSPLWPKETFEALQSLSLPTVRGNHDRWIEEFPDDKLSPAGLFARSALTAEQRRALHSLPSQIWLDDGILACHGTPDDDTTCLLEEALEDGRFVPARRDVLTARLSSAPTARVVLCGHSHRQAAVQGPGNRLVLNPGSVGCPVFADIPFAANLEHRSPHARYAILTKRTRGWQIELLALEYDWEAASAQALANGRPEWAEAMLSGHVK